MSSVCSSAAQRRLKTLKLEATFAYTSMCTYLPLNEMMLTNWIYLNVHVVHMGMHGSS
jgi:hypothetical protein